MHDQVAQNKRRSILLLVAFALVVAVVVSLILALVGLGAAGVAVGLVVGVGAAAVAYRTSDAVVLRLSRAVPADPTAHARLHNLVEGLCVASGLPKPAVYVIDDEAPNAFATGRTPKHAAVAVTTGLLDRLNRVELEAVLAHELSHIKHLDTLLATLAVTTVGLPTLVADLSIRAKWSNGGRRGHDEREAGSAPWLGFVGSGLLALSPVLAGLLRFGASPSREPHADAWALEMTRYPPGLIAALEKLRDQSTVVSASSRATAHLWIEPPVALVEAEGRLSDRNRCFATHPPIEDRLAVLREH